MDTNASSSTVATSDTATPHHIVVVGGGAGGLELATGLGDKLARKGRVRVTLVERSRIHLWKPLLHEIAAGSMDPAEHELDLLAQAHWHDFRYRLGEMTGLDRARKQILLAPVVDEEGREITPASTLSYDTLVIAVGSVTNDFGTPGVSRYAVPLDTPEQATRFNRRLINACLRAQTQHGPVLPGQLHVAIIGAGATGTELAAELHHTAQQLVSFGLDRIDPAKDIRIILIEAAPRILPALPERISRATIKLLLEMGVEVRAGVPVAEVTAEGVRLNDDSFIPAELVVWAAGVKGPDFLKDLDGLETTRGNQLVVLPTLQTTRDPEVFALGDCAACPRPGHGSSPVPPRAQAAHQEASHLLRQFRRSLAGKPLEPYVYRDFGSLVSLGEYSTVGSLMGFLARRALFVEGTFARIMYRSLYNMHEYALHGARRVLVSILARGLSRHVEPRVKLH
jgi:NADH dehydrogenase